MEHDERPGWSVTWLFRVQRRGRDGRERMADSGNQPSVFTKLFPWAVILLLLVEVGLLVYIGVLPR